MDVTYPLRRHAVGLTVLELLTTLAVAVTLTAFTVPALHAFSATQNTAAAVNRLNTDLLLARHAAVTGGERVVLCPSDNARNCTGGYDWSHGWIVFRDSDKDRRRDLDEQLLSVREEALSGVQLLTSRGRQKITYHSNGGTGGSNVSFRFCNQSMPSRNRSLIINITGRSRLSSKNSRGKPIVCKTSARGS